MFLRIIYSNALFLNCSSEILKFWIITFAPCHSADAFGEQGRDAEDGFPSIPPNAILNIDIELVSLKPVVDVTGDMKVIKKILRAGEGTRRPRDGETVQSKYNHILLR